MKQKTILFIIVIFSFFLSFPPSFTSAQDRKLPILTAPDIKVSVPGMDPLQNIQCEEGTCNIPWLGQYIAGLQNYAIGIVGIIAVIALMIGGIVWLTAGGNNQRISEAKKIIGGSMVGIVLVLSAYSILYLINPRLTVFKSLPVTYLRQVNLLELELVGHEPQFDSANGKPIGDTTFDQTFQSFAGCIDVDWRVLKGIAFKESHLDPKVVNKYGFIGLFQTKQIYCIESVRQIGLPSSFCNASVYDPAVNTAVATGMLKVNLATINKTCSSASDPTKIMMIYYGHSSGGGALGKAIKNHGCNPDSWPDSVFKGATKTYAKEVVETVLAQGVTSLRNTAGNSTCPD